MQWTMENRKDAEMAVRLDMPELPTPEGASVSQSAAAINARLREWRANWDRLMAERRDLESADCWLGKAAEALRQCQERVVMATWDALHALHSLILEREEAWHQLETHYCDQLDAAAVERKQVVAETVHSMRRTHKQYVEANPLRGEAHFMDLVSETPIVSAVTQRATEARLLRESAADRRRAEVVTRHFVKTRQREWFGLMTACPAR